MKVSDLIAALQDLPPNAVVEITKVLGINRSGDGYEVTLDAPLVGLGIRDMPAEEGKESTQEAIFLVEAGAHLVAFGKVKNLQTGKEVGGNPVTKACGDDDGGLMNCPPVKCQCKNCDGTFRGDGRNKQETLTFLVCDTCKCCYAVADKSKDPQ